MEVEATTTGDGKRLAAAHVRYRQTRDPGLRDELVAAYEVLVTRMARRFAGRGESLEDLTQVAYVGLLKALDRFDPARGYPFAGYAIPTIVGELKRHFRDRRWKVGVPRVMQERYLAVRSERDRLTQVLGRTPTVGDIAEALGCSMDEVVEATELGWTFSMSSLDAGPFDDERPRPAVTHQERSYESVEDRLFVEALVAQLGDRERRILDLRFNGDKTQTQVGSELGMGQMQVSRVLARTLKSLREAASAQLADC
jgi:RNA polymerase sigma-B factor